MELTSLLNHMGIFPLVSSSGGSETHDRIQTQTVEVTELRYFPILWPPHKTSRSSVEDTPPESNRAEPDQQMFWTHQLTSDHRNLIRSCPSAAGRLCQIWNDSFKMFLRHQSPPHPDPSPVWLESWVQPLPPPLPPSEAAEQTVRWWRSLSWNNTEYKQTGRPETMFISSCTSVGARSPDVLLCAAVGFRCGGQFEATPLPHGAGHLRVQPPHEHTATHKNTHNQNTRGKIIRLSQRQKDHLGDYLSPDTVMRCLQSWLNLIQVTISEKQTRQVNQTSEGERNVSPLNDDVIQPWSERV